MKKNRINGFFFGVIFLLSLSSFIYINGSQSVGLGNNPIEHVMVREEQESISPTSPDVDLLKSLFQMIVSFLPAS